MSIWNLITQKDYIDDGSEMHVRSFREKENAVEEFLKAIDKQKMAMEHNYEEHGDIDLLDVTLLGVEGSAFIITVNETELE